MHYTLISKLMKYKQVQLYDKWWNSECVYSLIHYIRNNNLCIHLTLLQYMYMAYMYMASNASTIDIINASTLYK